MGDPLSVASGVAGLLNIAGLMFSRTYKFAKAAKGAEASIQTLANEIGTLAGLLQSLSLVAIELETNPTDSAFRLQHVISCQQVLLKIERKTREADPASSGDNKVRAFVRKIKWPFSSEETMDLIAEVTRHQRVITVALSADSITHLQQLLSGQGDLRKDIRNIRKELDRRLELETRIALDKERHDVLQFFGSVDPTTNHKTSKGIRHRQTGLWLLSHDTFVAWNNNVRSRLWLSGIPGAGKTILASVVIEEMLGQSTPEKATAYFYCDYKDEQCQKLSNILGTIACQIARQDASQRSFRLLQDYYNSCHPRDKPASNPKAAKLLDLINDMSSSFDKVSIVVDALDECGSNRTEVVEALASLNEDIFSNINTVFLSRDELDIRDILQEFLHIPIAAHSDDLKIFVAEEIEARLRKRKLRIKNPGLKNEIMEKLIHGADGMFRWVVCQIDYLCTLPHDRARREALNSLPPDLNSTYERILGRVAVQPLSIQRIVRDTLLWTMRATKPLTTAALCEALSVEESSTHLDEESRPYEEVVLEYCGSLLRKAVSGEHFELAHFTVQEYLCSDVLRENEELAFFYTDSTEDTKHLAKICLKYLICEDFGHVLMRDYRTWQNFSSAHPFRSHASQYWNQYASANEDDQSIRELVQLLFHPRKSLHFTNWSQCYTVGTSISIDVLPEQIFFDATAIVATGGASQLHFAAILQLEWLMVWLLDEGLEVNQISQIGTPLHCALLGLCTIEVQLLNLQLQGMRHCSRPNYAILRLLSTFHADPAILYHDGDGHNYNTLAICMMTQSGDACRKLFGMFPRWTICFDSKCLELLEQHMLHHDHETVQWILDSLDGRYPDSLSMSKINNLTERLKPVIMESNATHVLRPRPETSRMLSLPQAIRSDEIESLEAPLGTSTKSVNEIIMSERTTSLHLAVASDSPKTTDLSLALGANIDAHDDNGQTALHKCAYGSSADIFGMLLRKGADPSKADNMGRTVWHLAAGANNVAVLQVLLQQYTPGIIGISKTDYRGLTPLFTAAEAGSEDSLLLLSHFTNSFEGMIEDGLGFAHLAVFLSLSTCRSLVKKGLDLNVRSNDGSTVLHYFIKVLHLKHTVGNQNEILGKIQYLVDMGQSLGAVNDYGQNPLQTLLSRDSWTTGRRNNHPTGEYLPPPQDAEGSSTLPPLQPPPPLTDIDSPLDENILLSIVGVLSTRETVNNRDCNGMTTLELFCSHKTLQEKDRKILETLFTMGAESAIRCSSGKMPLQVLFETHESCLDSPRKTEFLDLLLVMLKHMDNSNELFKTSLSARILYWAVRAGHRSLTKELLAKRVNPSWRLSDLSYNSALDLACELGDSAKLLQALLENCDEEDRNRPHPVTGRNLLHILCSMDSRAQDSELMEVCIRMRLNIEAQDNEFKETPLLLAIQNADHGKLDFARLLIERGANISVQNSEGHSAAYYAILSESVAAVQLVDDTGALCEALPSPVDVSIQIHDGKPRQISGTLWHLAANREVGAVDILQYLFERGVITDIDHYAASGETALHISSYKGDPEALRYLISNGADPGSSNSFGETALHLAAESGQVSSIHILHSVGAKMDATTSRGMLPLHYAVKNVENEAIDALLKLGSPYCPDKDHMTPYAYAYGEPWLSSRTKRLLREHELSNLGSKSSTEQAFANILKIAIEHLDLDLCEQLVEQGGRPEAIHVGCESCTPVCLAYNENSLEIVSLLVEYGFPVTGRLCEAHGEYRGFNPLLLALTYQNVGLFKLALQSSESPLSFQNDNLVFATLYFDAEECLEALLIHLEEKAVCSLDPDIKVNLCTGLVNAQLRIADLLWLDETRFQDDIDLISFECAEGCIAIHQAVAAGSENATRLLLQHGADVNVPTNVGTTPLHIAAEIYSSEIPLCLIQNGANIDARDRDLQTAAMIAACEGNLEVLEILFNCGANFSSRDIFGDDVLAYSCNSTAPVLAFVLSKGYRPTLDCRGLSPLGSALRSKCQGVPTLALNSALAFDHAADLARICLEYVIRENDPSLLRKLLRRASLSTTPFPTSKNATLSGITSVLHCAISTNRPEMLDVLLQHGADIEFHAEMEGTPLITACSTGCLSCVKLLVRRGAAISYRKDGTVWSGVRVAERYPEIVAWILCGRFTSQKALSGRAHPDTVEKPCVLWAGTKALEIPLSGELRRQWEESLLEQCIRISQFRRSRLGTLWEGI